jgi:hypothetical protein
MGHAMQIQPDYMTFYAMLAPFGITPDSTMEHIRGAGFDLMEQPGGITKAQRLAWDALRKVETRLVADFLCWSPSGPNVPPH